MQDNSAALDATPAGVRLSDWIADAPIGKTAAYELLKALGITPAKLKLPGVSAAVSMLSEAEAQAMDRAAAAVAGGNSIAELTALVTNSRTTATDRGRSAAAASEPTGPTPEALLTRLQAVQLAAATGAPLTTAEAAWLLGARPGAAVVTRGRLTAERVGRNCWTLTTNNRD
jgi:hypothetical protein